MPAAQNPNSKYRKNHKIYYKTNNFSFSNFYSSTSIAIINLKPLKITSNQLEAARISISRHLPKDIKIIVKIHAQFPVTSKGIGTRLGGGKGSVEKYITSVPEGTSIFEIRNYYNLDKVKDIVHIVGSKFGSKFKPVARNFIYSYESK